MDKIINSTIKSSLKSESITINSSAYGNGKNHTNRSIEKNAFLRNSNKKTLTIGG